MKLTIITSPIFYFAFFAQKSDAEHHPENLLRGKLQDKNTDNEKPMNPQRSLQNSLLDTEKQQMFLNMHNEFRREIALGNEEGQPSATNMKKMEWDAELFL